MATEIQEKASGTAYGSMVNAIFADLQSGELCVGDRLPTERELRETYAISINSVRRGIGLFVDEGLLSRRRGSGVYVAQVPRGPVAPAVARDTIVLHYDTWFRHYHPYYSELRRGIRDALPRLGWKSEMLMPVGDDPYQADFEVVYGAAELSILGERFAGRHHMAGAILPASQAAQFGPYQPAGVPIVVVGKQDAVPYVGYDWDEELVTGIRAVLRRGARHLMIMGAAATDPARAVQQAAWLEGCQSELGRVTILPANNDLVHYSRFTAAAYEQALAHLSDHPDTDGVVVGNDFEAQGAFDAVAELQSAAGQRHLAALVSKESRLLASLPYDCVVADGYAVGQAIVEHLHALIVTPEEAPRTVDMRGVLKRY